MGHGCVSCTDETLNVLWGLWLAAGGEKGQFELTLEAVRSFATGQGIESKISEEPVSTLQVFYRSLGLEASSSFLERHIRVFPDSAHVPGCHHL
eukprot:372525-Pyramimonas_sp.AAC.1